MKYLWLLVCLSVVSGSPRILKGDSDSRFVITSESNALDYSLEANGKVVLRGQLGLSLPDAVGRATETCEPGDSDVCYEWGDFSRLYLTAPRGEDNCATVEWYSAFGKRLEDCFDLVDGIHWYGGGETKVQTWPIESVGRDEVPYVSGDFLQGFQFGGVLETYWLASSGVALHVQEEAPLFTSWNTVRKNKFCLVAQDRYPYVQREDLRLKYNLCVPKEGENLKDVHVRSLKKFYTLPTLIPDEDMLLYPFWSTWAQYKEAITQDLVVKMGNRIVAEGYTKNSHVEIDDHWETCYGEAEFNPTKFSDPKEMIRQLSELGITKTTMWIHPFINRECPSYQTAFERGYFVKNSKSRQALTTWWQGQNSGLIDFANPEAVNWWRARLEKLQSDFGITSFKFDAGETNWLPPSVKLTQGDPLLLPNLLSTQYVEAVSSFGGMVETRTGHRNQKLPIFIRMLDKDSRWSNDNGLQSLIPSLLLFSVLGYSYVLPDMIGGNAYNGDVVTHEMYIRWAQANVFMPSWQFSVLPWDQDPTGERDRLVKAAVDLRIAYSDKILAAAKQTAADGTPMNRPLWWVDPEDSITYNIGDQFMLGDDILVAPVLEEGAVSRDIYLPKGVWSVDTDAGEITIPGPQWLRSWSAPLNNLPFFRKTA